MPQSAPCVQLCWVARTTFLLALILAESAPQRKRPVLAVWIGQVQKVILEVGERQGSNEHFSPSQYRAGSRSSAGDP